MRIAGIDEISQVNEVNQSGQWERERVDPYFLSLNNKNSKRQQEAE